MRQEQTAGTAPPVAARELARGMFALALGGLIVVEAAWVAFLVWAVTLVL